MRTPRQRRGATPIAPVRWTAYAAAGVASAFAAANSAEAEIHYSGPINQKFTDNSSRGFQLGQGGASLFFVHRLHYYSTSNVDGGSALFGIGAARGASCNGFYNTCVYDPEIASVSNLERGAAISTRPFVPNGGDLATREGFGCGGGARGQFLHPGVGFIGFKFNRGSGDQYGWVRIQMRGYSKNEFKVVDFAYGDPGDRIKTGQTSSPSGPELESLGGLAIGAAGIMAWRRRRLRLAALRPR